MVGQHGACHQQSDRHSTHTKHVPSAIQRLRNPPGRTHSIQGNAGGDGNNGRAEEDFFPVALGLTAGHERNTERPHGDIHPHVEGKENADDIAVEKCEADRKRDVAVILKTCDGGEGAVFFCIPQKQSPAEEADQITQGRHEESKERR